MTTNNNLKTILEKLDTVINEAADDESSVPLFINFLRGFLRTKDPRFSLPSSEVMTIIKHKKPNVFYYLKKQAKQNPSLDLLTQLTIDYDKAVARLEELKKKL